MEQQDFNPTKRYKKKILFILLLTATLTVFLSEIKFDNSVLNRWFDTACFRKPYLDLKLKSELDVQRCSYHHISPEDEADRDRRLEALSWPETLPLPKPFSLTVTTSVAHSSFSISAKTLEPQSRVWRVGEELRVKIQLRDFSGNPKQRGGDFLICRLHSPALGAAVVGQVHDHLNGTFTAVFPLLWNGTAEVEVNLVQSSEAITALKRLTKEQPGRIYYASDFSSGLVAETTICNVCLDPDKVPVCNFTNPINGEQWFCQKPPTLDCNTRISHVKQGISVNISKEEESLFQSGINMKAFLNADGSKTIEILPGEGAPKNVSSGPSGFYYQNEWRRLQGSKIRQFNNASIITACLKEKQLHMFGDSTVRQFYEFIVGKVQNLMRFDKHSAPQCGPFLAVDQTNDIMMTFRCHGPPLRSYKIHVSQMQHVANELDRLKGGENTVVVIGVWAHFPSYPMEVYYERLMVIRKAVQRLQHRAPGTKVIVRTANMSKLTSPGALTDSDWYLHQLDRVLRAVFGGSPVLLLDAWQMVQAHHLPHNIHPPEPIIKLMVDQILSYTCPGLL